MSDLIKRLQYVLDNTHDHEAFALARDCKAEIERLIVWPSELLDKIERLSKPYTTMTYEERVALMIEHFAAHAPDALLVAYETAVIARYNEQRGVK